MRTASGSTGLRGSLSTALRTALSLLRPQRMVRSEFGIARTGGALAPSLGTPTLSRACAGVATASCTRARTTAPSRCGQRASASWCAPSRAMAIGSTASPAPQTRQYDLARTTTVAWRQWMQRRWRPRLRSAMRRRAAPPSCSPRDPTISRSSFGQAARARSRSRASLATCSWSTLSPSRRTGSGWRPAPLMGRCGYGLAARANSSPPSGATWVPSTSCAGPPTRACWQADPKILPSRCGRSRRRS
mmetsp:Transcript_3822/g.8666  ORF Transcript_3822/g.8666 Transcript_3822/m.8666 type:complete len:246 (-) Transcript_3822:490-1227(-)